ncbi:MAG: carbamoyl-phosphate synthase large subunit [Firmicutes bacterium]|nr:carbamoyl-phosphate synthase large subunit [Bacillota bacterium]
MPKHKDIKKVLVIGSGPIVIGQAAEFDYAGTQACRALKKEGMEVVLVNSNPATIMTDNVMADSIYIEPLTIDTIKRIIMLEKPDSLLPSLGGQTGLTLSMQLATSGFLDEQGVKLLGIRVDSIQKAEDRELFKRTMLEIGQPCIPSGICVTVEEALAVADKIGYPVIVRPAYTLGGAGGGFADDAEKLKEVASGGLAMSPITQVLIEKSIYGWKEVEYEVMRDGAGNVIIVCAMENMDPVGIHTGDSIVVAPTMTLSDKEYQMMRTASIDIITALGIEGGCNVQLALNPHTFEYAVIEVNPRVSRSSALASKATGYPIAKVATLIALGYNLDEITNSLTGNLACYEPVLDYCVVKLPKFPFDKFIYAKRALGTQMKATGEVMAIAPSFEMAIMKAVRGSEGYLNLQSPIVAGWNDERVKEELMPASDYRLYVVYEALKRGFGIEYVMQRTMIDKWFLQKIQNLVDYENRLLLTDAPLKGDEYLEGKRLGYPDAALEKLSGGRKIAKKQKAVFKTVDTCAAEFTSDTPYFYSSYDNENEALLYREKIKSDKKRVIVFGSGPIRIGQGIEFDYATVHCVWALKKLGCEVVVVNNNPETVSTDFDTADRLYFEMLTPEDVDNIIATEKPWGVVVAFGGQTAIKLTKHLSDSGVKILGTSADSIDAAEDRERFDKLLEENRIKRPEGTTVKTLEEALLAGSRLGYPVLMRPSYVLGGQNMIIAFSENDIKEYMGIILELNPNNTILIDKYMMGTEIEVDAICDGKDILIPGIMEHIERAGVHSGDSIAVYPAHNISDAMALKIVDYTKKLAKALKTVGLINIQYIVSNGEIYCIEVNPRSSRTVPYISKVTGVPMIYLATACMLGKKLKDLGYGTGLYKNAAYVAVKVPVFSFEKLTDLDTQLGPEMKSTGEVLGIGKSLDEALYKGLIAAGYRLKPKRNGVLITVKDADKSDIANTAKMYDELGYKLYATHGTANVLEKAGLVVMRVDKVSDNPESNTYTLLESGKVDLMISTSTKGRIPTDDDVKLRRKSVSSALPCLTSIDTANALALSLKSRYSQFNTELVNINKMRTESQEIEFIKMYATGGDYIYIDCMKKPLYNFESVAVNLCDKENGVGADGVVFIVSPKDKSAAARMRLFGADGIEIEMGGNAIRGVAKYLYDNDKTCCKDCDYIDIETKYTKHRVRLFTRGGVVNSCQVEMGSFDFDINQDADLDVDGEKLKLSFINTGCPYVVVFSDDISKIDVDKWGKVIQSSQEGARLNIAFVNVLDDGSLRVRVWENITGETRGCGNGAAAAFTVARKKDLIKNYGDVVVKMKGGEVWIRDLGIDGFDKIFMIGDCIEVFRGVVRL